MKSILIIGACLGCLHSCNPSAEPAAEKETGLERPSPYPAQADIDTSLTYLMGHFDPSQHEAFVLVDTLHADRPGLFLRRDTYTAFKSMYEAAAKEGIQFTIRSATRNFEYQKGIWERKWSGTTKLEGGTDATTMADYRERALAILRYSSMPGSSRHHWGTDIDLNSFSNAYFETGQGKQEYDWLVEHGPSFGFCQPYTAKGKARPEGYEEEKWHWSYYPVSAILTEAARSKFREDRVEGFSGSETAARIRILERYILGINSECLVKH